MVNDGIHKNMGDGENHPTHNWTFADLTARDAQTGFTALDVGKDCRVGNDTDGYVFYRVVKVAAGVATWEKGGATDLSGYVPTTRTINTKALSSNITLNQDDIGDGTTAKQYTATEKTKLGYLTVTQAVDLDDLETKVNSLTAAIVLKGNWSANAGTFPSSAMTGYCYIVNVAGTVNGVEFNLGDRLVAIVDNPSTTVYVGNWLIEDYTDRVSSVNGQTGAVTIDVSTKEIAQNLQSADYLLVLGDSGKHIFHPSTDNNPRTFTIPANASVPFPVGTAITFVNLINTITIAITTDTLILSSAGTTGSRTLAANGIATALKVTSTSWIISGTGLT